MVEGAKIGQNGLKMGSKHLFEHPKWSAITFGKICFRPILDPFWGPKWPIYKAFCDFT